MTHRQAMPTTASPTGKRKVVEMNPRRLGVAFPDRGATAVEFALLLPLLMLLLFGIIDFGRALNAQITITQAAREGARVAALAGATTSSVQTRTINAAIGLNLTAANVPSPVICQSGDGAAGKNSTVTVNYTFNFITPVGAIAKVIGGGNFGSTLQLSAVGVMPCET